MFTNKTFKNSYHYLIYLGALGFAKIGGLVAYSTGQTMGRILGKLAFYV